MNNSLSTDTTPIVTIDKGYAYWGVYLLRGPRQVSGLAALILDGISDWGLEFEYINACVQKFIKEIASNHPSDIINIHET